LDIERCGFIKPTTQSNQVIWIWGWGIEKSRYEEETSMLAKRRANFERDREGMTVAEEEQYENYCEQTVFRIRILEERHAYHEAKALEK
jgi:hypothetical protein